MKNSNQILSSYSNDTHKFLTIEDGWIGIRWEEKVETYWCDAVYLLWCAVNIDEKNDEKNDEKKALWHIALDTAKRSLQYVALHSAKNSLWMISEYGSDEVTWNGVYGDHAKQKDKWDRKKGLRKHKLWAGARSNLKNHLWYKALWDLKTVNVRDDGKNRNTLWHAVSDAAKDSLWRKVWISGKKPAEDAKWGDGYRCGRNVIWDGKNKDALWDAAWNTGKDALYLVLMAKC